MRSFIKLYLIVLLLFEVVREFVSLGFRPRPW
jgi:hypothetical protein